MKPTVAAWLEPEFNSATTSLRVLADWRNNEKDVVELIRADEHSVTVSKLQDKLDFLQERHNALMLRYDATCNERNELLKELEIKNDSHAN